MSKMPESEPESIAEDMQGYSFFSFLFRYIEYNSIGKKISFVCSQIDSLTGENNATKKLFPEKLYAK